MKGGGGMENCWRNLPDQRRGIFCSHPVQNCMLPRAIYWCLFLFLPFHVSFPYHGICILILVPHFCSDEVLLPSLLRSLETTLFRKYFFGFCFALFFGFIFYKVYGKITLSYKYVWSFQDRTENMILSLLLKPGSQVTNILWQMHMHTPDQIIN